MNASSGRTLGIIAIILLVLIIAGPVRYFLFAPVGVVHGVFNGFHLRHFDGNDFWAWPWIGLAGFLALAALALWIVVLVWVYRDAERRRMSGTLWVIIVFFVHLIGLLIYFLVRADHPIASREAAPATPAPAPTPAPGCPKCGKPIDKDHAYCPSCGEALKRVCPKCGREVQPDWKACPNCAQKL